MKKDEWTAALPDGRNVKYTFRQLTDTIATISAQLVGNDIVHMHNNVRASITREQVEADFASELIQK